MDDQNCKTNARGAVRLLCSEGGDTAQYLYHMMVDVGGFGSRPNSKTCSHGHVLPPLRVDIPLSSLFSSFSESTETIANKGKMIVGSACALGRWCFLCYLKNRASGLKIRRLILSRWPTGLHPIAHEVCWTKSDD